MNTYTTYQTAAQATRPTYATRHTHKAARKKGNAGAIARLIVMALIAVIGILSSFGTIPEYAQRRGLGLAILEAFGGCGVLLLLAAWFWGLMKWIATVAPKSFGAAKKFWGHWIPLTFLGLYLKAAVFLIIAMVPVMIFGMTYIPLFHITMHFTQTNIDFFSALLLLVVGAGTVGFLGFWDICKIKGLAPMAVIREKLAQRKR